MFYLITDTNVTHTIPNMTRIGETPKGSFVYQLNVKTMGDATSFMHQYGGSISRTRPELKPSGCIPPLPVELPVTHFATT